jgi:hypothetical protein
LSWSGAAAGRSAITHAFPIGHGGPRRLVLQGRWMGAAAGAWGARYPVHKGNIVALVMSHNHSTETEVPILWDPIVAAVIDHVLTPFQHISHQLVKQHELRAASISKRSE